MEACASKSWREVWREGVAPQLSKLGLEALLEAIRTDDPELIQGLTTNPAPMRETQDEVCRGGCLISYPLWKGDELTLVGDVEEAFADVYFHAGESSTVEGLLRWYDDTDREVMRREMIPKVERELRRRESEAAALGLR